MNNLKIILFISVVFICFLGVFKVKRKAIQIISGLVLLGCFLITISMVLKTNKSVKYANSTYRMKVKAEQLKALYESYGEYEKIPPAELAVVCFKITWQRCA